LAFFKAIKELSGAAMLCQFDIPEYLQKLNVKWGVPKEQMRWLRRPCPMELSGRLEAPEVISRMDRLSVPYQADDPPPDICLATNIIEVGVDIPRLSLLVMDGPPGSAARYIQVSGRVGREWERAPGLVITLYNAGKPRDLSHFEHFYGDHLRLYAAVEPNSVTPYSEEAVDRHLHTAIVAWVRSQVGLGAPGFSANTKRIIEEFLERIQKRIERTFEDTARRRRASAEIDRRAREFLERWKRNPDLQKWVIRAAGQDLALLLPAGPAFSESQLRAGTRTMETLRSVDGVAQLRVIADGELQ
jgi:superfamily II DNA/RNA helicase